MSTQSAAAFAATEAIRAGEWDAYLHQIAFAVKARQKLLDPLKKPDIPLEPAQRWVWMTGPGMPHWEVVGTGAIFP